MSASTSPFWLAKLRHWTLMSGSYKQPRGAALDAGASGLILPHVRFSRRTRGVKMDETDLTTGAREFHDLDDQDKEEELVYKGMNWKQKAKWQLSNW